MPSPIYIRILKKTHVPTKRQIRHNLRSDWKYLATIDYDKSAQIFYYIGGGPLKNDCQFAKTLYDNFGEGEYLLIYWKLNMKGFKKFMQVICDEEGYQLTKANPNSLRLNAEKREVFYKLKELKLKFNATDDEDERKYLYQEIRDCQEKFNRVINHPGPFPYLDCIKRKYQPHSYDEADAETEREAEEREQNREHGWIEEQQRKDEEELEESTKWVEEQEREEERKFQEEGGWNIPEEDVNFDYSDEEIEGREGW